MIRVVQMSSLNWSEEKETKIDDKRTVFGEVRVINNVNLCVD